MAEDKDLDKDLDKQTKRPASPLLPTMPPCLPMRPAASRNPPATRRNQRERLGNGKYHRQASHPSAHHNRHSGTGARRDSRLWTQVSSDLRQSRLLAADAPSKPARETDRSVDRIVGIKRVWPSRIPAPKPPASQLCNTLKGNRAFSPGYCRFDVATARAIVNFCIAASDCCIALVGRFLPKL